MQWKWLSLSVGLLMSACSGNEIPTLEVGKNRSVAAPGDFASAGDEVSSPNTAAEDAKSANQEATETSPSTFGQESIPKQVAGTRTVMVIDDGFDVDHPVFEDKVLGSYTMSCSRSRTSQSIPSTVSEMEQQLLQRYQNPDICQAIPGIQLPLNPDLDLIDEEEKAAWNEAVRSKSVVDTFPAIDAARIQTIIGGGPRGSYATHGTGTAGVIAYQNPTVRFVFVQIPLASGGSGAGRFNPCSIQETMELELQAYSNPMVREAFINGPASTWDLAIEELVVQYGVSIINKSYGRVLREPLEAALREAGCQPSANWAAYYEAIGNLESSRAARLATIMPNTLAGALTFQAAGNNPVIADSYQDSWSCSDTSLQKLVIGSYNITGDASGFTVTGGCVDLYALGENVIVPAPGGFLTVASGTSFSSPAAVRYATLNYPDTMPIAELKESLVEAATAEFLPLDDGARELAYEDVDKDIASYSLASTQEIPENLTNLPQLPLHGR